MHSRTQLIRCELTDMLFLADIKQAELKLMNLYQEFIILLNFEVQDNQLLAKQSKSKKDSVAIQQEVMNLESMLKQLR